MRISVRIISVVVLFSLAARNATPATDRPETRACNPDPFPAVASKKGLQVQMVDDALALGVKHAALNVNLGTFAASTNGEQTISWHVGDKECFLHPGALVHLDHQVKALSDAGVIVSLILLAYEPGDPALRRILLHPNYSSQCPNHLGAFNTVTDEGRRHLVE